MVLPLVLVIVATVMVGLAAWADRHFRDEARLPMQWSLAGTVNWSAPRRIAVAFIPAVAGLTFAAVAILALVVSPRAGQEGEVLPASMILGAMFLACQLFHLWLVARTVHR